MDKFLGNSKREYTPEFKAKVALEALKERKSQKEIGEEFDVHSARVCEWRKELVIKASQIFKLRSDCNEEDSSEREAKLFQQIGELSHELEWL
jgi:transposase